MFNRTEYKGTSVEYCELLQPEADIRDLEFKVCIPRLMPRMPKDGLIDKPEFIAVDRFINKNHKPNIKIDTSNYIVAKTMTDYRGTMKIPLHKNQNMWTPTGTSASFESSSSQTHTTVLDETEMAPVIPVPHAHWINEGIGLYNSTFSDHYGYDRELALSELFGLNEVIVKFKKDMIGLFISGNMNDLRILHIPDVIPMDQEIPDNHFGIPKYSMVEEVD